METRGNNTAASDVKLRARGGGGGKKGRQTWHGLATPLRPRDSGLRSIATKLESDDSLGWDPSLTALGDRPETRPKQARSRPPACTSSPSATSGRETQERRALRPAAGGIYRHRVAFVPHASFCRQCKLRPSTSDKAPAGGRRSRTR